MGKDPRNQDSIDPDKVSWQRVGDKIIPAPREAGPPSERTRRPGETNAQYNMRQPEFRAAHQLGDCQDCGRNEGHRWHQGGTATIGDGSSPHPYNPPKGEPGLTFV